jgi:serine/threonine protein kinase
LSKQGRLVPSDEFPLDDRALLHEVLTESSLSASVSVDNDSTEADSSEEHPSYTLASQIGRGANGDVWRAMRLGPDGSEQGAFVLKRLHSNPRTNLTDNRAAIEAKRSGLREAWFGTLPRLKGHPHLSRFVEYFVRTMDGSVTGSATAAGNAKSRPSRCHSAHLECFAERHCGNDGPVGESSGSYTDASRKTAKTAAGDGSHHHSSRDESGSIDDSVDDPDTEETDDLGAQSVDHHPCDFVLDASLELWLVFKDEGVSLHRVLFQPSSNGAADADVAGEAAEQPPDADATDAMASGDANISHRTRARPKAGTRSGTRSQSHQSSLLGLAPSVFWLRLRLEASGGGGRVMKTIMHQLVSAAAACQAAGVTHRDIKASNVFLSSVVDQEHRSRDSEASQKTINSSLIVRLGDFGSAVDAHTARCLYGCAGPSQSEETTDYAPPEVRLTANADIPFARDAPGSYDAWSLGVTWLEMLLGVPAADLFQPPPKQAAIIRQRMVNQPPYKVQQALTVAGMMALCIAPNGTLATIEEVHSTNHHQHQHHTAVGSGNTVLCNLQGFRQMLARADKVAHHRAIVAQRVYEAATAAAASEQAVAVRSQGDVVSTRNLGAVDEEAASHLAAVTVHTEPSSHGLTLTEWRRFHDAALVASHALTVSSATGSAVSRSASQYLEGEALMKALAPLPHRMARYPDVRALAHLYEAAVSRGSSLVPASSPVSVVPRDGPSIHGTGRIPASSNNGNNGNDPAQRSSFTDPAAGDSFIPLLGPEGEELLYRLLQWDPSERILPEDAIRHPYFDRHV